MIRPPSARANPTQEPTGIVDRLLHLGEYVVYLLIGLILLAGSIAILGATVWNLVVDMAEGAEAAVIGSLSPLLVAFILVELLAAVLVTVRQRQLLAEPFLLVGVIVAIKEIVLSALQARDAAGTEDFEDLIALILALSFLLFVLAISSYLLRRKEREPPEAEPEVR